MRRAPDASLPYPVTSFIGRAEELRSVKALLDAHRLVTLTGPAGIGKTRLALEVVRELAPSYADDGPGGGGRTPTPGAPPIERHFFEDVPVARIADGLGVSRQTLGERQRKAMRQLRAARHTSIAAVHT